MKTEFHTTDVLIEKNNAPLNPSVIPNNMGINLCSVEGMSWTRRDDGQLVSLTIHFLPEENKELLKEYVKQWKENGGSGDATR